MLRRQQYLKLTNCNTSEIVRILSESIEASSMNQVGYELLTIVGHLARMLYLTCEHTTLLWREVSFVLYNSGVEDNKIVKCAVLYYIPISDILDNHYLGRLIKYIVRPLDQVLYFYIKYV